MQNKSRHGCLTTFLVLMVIANALVAFTYLVNTNMIAQAIPNVSTTLVMVLGVLSLANVACAIGLFQWKKWGFWGFCATSVISLLINLQIGLGIAQSVGGLLAILILYWVLNMGDDNKGWPQLD